MTDPCDPFQDTDCPCQLCGGLGHPWGMCPGPVDPRYAETERIRREARPALEQRPMGIHEDGE
jgi:hypothetical protein